MTHTHTHNSLRSPLTQHTPHTTQAGGYVKESVVHNLIALISNAEELQPYAVRRLYAALVDARGAGTAGSSSTGGAGGSSKSGGDAAPSLLYAAAWCIGEYGEMLPTGETKGGGARRGGGGQEEEGGIQGLGSCFSGGCVCCSGFGQGQEHVRCVSQPSHN